VKWIATLITALLLVPTSLQAQHVIAKDSCGLIVEVCQKYGPCMHDTCAVLSIWNGNFVLTKRTLPSAHFPESFHSVRVVSRLTGEAASAESDGQNGGCRAPADDVGTRVMEWLSKTK